MATQHVWTNDRRIKAAVVLMFFDNPSFVSGQAGVIAASLRPGVRLRCQSSSAKVECIVLNPLITVTADCRRIFAPSAILSVIVFGEADPPEAFSRSKPCLAWLTRHGGQALQLFTSH
jgi:hypothetical protein